MKFIHDLIKMSVVTSLLILSLCLFTVNNVSATGMSPTLTPNPTLMGDTDNDGDIDEADYSRWLSSYKQNVTGANLGDFNNDGKNNGIDFVIWTTTFTGAISTPTPTIGVTTTPTPTPDISPTPSPIFTPVPTQTKCNDDDDDCKSKIKRVLLNPIDDAYVGYKERNKNFGKKTNLLVGSKLTREKKKITFIKFDLKDLADKDIKSAKMRLKVASSTASLLTFKHVSNNDWSENTITYKNKPSFTSTITRKFGRPKGRWVEVNVTKLVKKLKGKQITIGIEQSGLKDISFISKESKKDIPQLVVEVVE